MFAVETQFAEHRFAFGSRDDDEAEAGAGTGHIELLFGEAGGEAGDVCQDDSGAFQPFERFNE